MAYVDALVSPRQLRHNQATDSLCDTPFAPFPDSLDTDTITVSTS